MTTRSYSDDKKKVACARTSQFAGKKVCSIAKWFRERASSPDRPRLDVHGATSSKTHRSLSFLFFP